MKFHVNILEAVASILDQVFVQHEYADKVIESTLKSNKKWGAKDRALIAESAYDIIRHYRLIHFLAGEKTDWKKMIAIYFLVFKHEKILLPTFQPLQEHKIAESLSACKNHRAIQESYPDWMDTLFEKELGDQWNVECKCLNESAKVVLRVNTLKTTRSALMQLLAEEEIDTYENENYPSALILRKRKNVFITKAFKAGLFEVQDASSQLVAPFLDVAPGMRVIDACAGGGGKSLHLASLMKNSGRIIALDTENWKLAELNKRSKRNGIDIIETRWIENNKIIKRLHESADRVLLDVPCSGSGVLKRNPDAKWKLSPEFIERVKGMQHDILQQYSKLVKLNGKLVYSTCSILPSENQHQLASFLAESSNRFILEEEKIILPSESGFDGFYMARLRRIQ